MQIVIYCNISLCDKTHKMKDATQYKQYVQNSTITKISNVKNRPNKTAKGMTYTWERQCKTKANKTKANKILSFEVNTLIVRGTLDILAKRTGGVLSISKKISIEHPIDKGYFKQVYVLSDVGKRLLREAKNKYFYI